MGKIKQQMIHRLDQATPQVRLADLHGRGQNVQARCQRCDHQHLLELDMLIKRFGPHMPIPEIGARIHCPHCASKAVATTPDTRYQKQTARRSGRLTA